MERNVSGLTGQTFALSSHIHHWYVSEFIVFRSARMIFNLVIATKTPFFVITITKTKRFFMGALVGALILTFLNETKGKQHLNRGYDSESGTTFPFYTSLKIPMCF